MSTITLNRERSFSLGMFTMFNILVRIQSDWANYPDPETGKIISITKEPKQLDIDYSGVEKKFYLWHYSKETIPELIYNEQESEILKKALQIAYDEALHGDLPVFNRDLFIKFYNKIMQQ